MKQFLLSIFVLCCCIGTTTAQTDLPGCTDPAAINYNPQATADDGTCIYFPTDTGFVCPQVFDPVCVADVGTFPNSCIAELLGFPNWEAGECENDFPPPGDNPCNLTADIATTAATCGNADGTAIITVTPPGTYTYTWSNGDTGPTVNGLEAGIYFVDVTNADGCVLNLLLFIETDCNDFPGDTTVVCDEDFEPVCVPDFGTFPNACIAELLGFDNWEPGACEGDDPIEPCVCTDEWDPVCADGITYANACEAACFGVEDFELGACEGDDPIDPCNCDLDLWEPVCVDGLTYPNACVAECFGLDNWEAGVCEEDDPIDPEPCDPSIDEPVCVEGVGTFPNSCLAELLGFPDWVPGVCDDEPGWPPVGPCDFTVEYDVTNATCGNADGSITLTISGGTGPFDILWTNGEIGETVDGLATGLYVVDVIDASGCLEHICIILGDDCTGNGDIYGCTDPASLNFNPFATIDDGSCIYPGDDPGYPQDSTFLCFEVYEPVCVEGVGTLPNACFAELFGFFDWTEGECEQNDFPIEILGCTDPNALNYNPLATIDDDSCIYGIISEGHTNPNHLQDNAARADGINAITFPNPATNEVRVDVEMPEDDVVTLSIFNLLGQQVQTASSRMNKGANTMRLDVSGLQEGSYWMHIQSTKGKTNISRLVKTK